MLIPRSRGSLSEALFAALSAPDGLRREALPALPATADDLADEQIALWVLYELHYRGFDNVPDTLEWHPGLLQVRSVLERSLEDRLRARFVVPEVGDDVAASLFDYVAAHDGRSLASYVHRTADREQVLELVRMRSVYHLKETDPTAWVLPRLPRDCQAALAELMYDEYGAGRPPRVHSELFARAMSACGLDDRYGGYVDEVPVEVLEQNNAMSLFGLHRRLRGAAVGHLAAFEATSSLPSRRMAQGLGRLGMPPELVSYYTEHVEADAVHEQLAVRAICAPLVADDASLVADVFFGAFTCLDLEDRFAGAMLGGWAVAA